MLMCLLEGWTVKVKLNCCSGPVVFCSGGRTGVAGDAERFRAGVGGIAIKAGGGSSWYCRSSSVACSGAGGPDSSSTSLSIWSLKDC